MYIRLEYSESAGHFHFSALNEKGENTNGYITLSSKISSQHAEQFCEKLRLKFPENRTSQGMLSFAQVQTEFLDYISAEIKLMRETMANTYKQRSQLYRKH